MTAPWEFSATVDHVVDADTYDVRVDLGFRVGFGTRIRLRGVDAPERYTDAGKAATERVRGLLLTTGPITILTSKPDKYGRSVADVILSDGRDLATLLLDEGHAAPYPS